jgi:hypothetical protein
VGIECFNDKTPSATGTAPLFALENVLAKSEGYSFSAMGPVISDTRSKFATERLGLLLIEKLSGLLVDN